MNSVRKVVVVAISFAMLMLVLASIPGFAETQEDLKQMFVTREEFNNWAFNGTEVSFIKYGTSQNASSVFVKVSEVVHGDMSRVLESVEEMGALRVQVQCEIEMSRRNIRDNNLTTEASSGS